MGDVKAAEGEAEAMFVGKRNVTRNVRKTKVVPSSPSPVVVDEKAKRPLLGSKFTPGSNKATRPLVKGPLECKDQQFGRAGVTGG